MKTQGLAVGLCPLGGYAKEMSSPGLFPSCSKIGTQFSHLGYHTSGFKTTPPHTDVGSVIEGSRRRSGLCWSSSYQICLSTRLERGRPGSFAVSQLDLYQYHFAVNGHKEFFPALDRSDLVEDETIKMFHRNMLLVISNCDWNSKSIS